MAVAGALPHHVGLVSMHGTGTPLGDPIEVNALGQALAAPVPRPVVLCELPEGQAASEGCQCLLACPALPVHMLLG